MKDNAFKYVIVALLALITLFTFLQYTSSSECAYNGTSSSTCHYLAP